MTAANLSGGRSESFFSFYCKNRDCFFGVVVVIVNGRRKRGRERRERESSKGTKAAFFLVFTFSLFSPSPSFHSRTFSSPCSLSFDLSLPSLSRKRGRDYSAQVSCSPALPRNKKKYDDAAGDPLAAPSPQRRSFGFLFQRQEGFFSRRCRGRCGLALLLKGPCRRAGEEAPSLFFFCMDKREGGEAGEKKGGVTFSSLPRRKRPSNEK